MDGVAPGRAVLGNLGGVGFRIEGRRGFQIIGRLYG